MRCLDETDSDVISLKDAQSMLMPSMQNGSRAVDVPLYVSHVYWIQCAYSTPSYITAAVAQAWLSIGAQACRCVLCFHFAPPLPSNAHAVSENTP